MDGLTPKKRSWNTSRIRGKDTKSKWKSGDICFHRAFVFVKMIRDFLESQM